MAGAGQAPNPPETELGRDHGLPTVARGRARSGSTARACAARRRRGAVIPRPGVPRDAESAQADRVRSRGSRDGDAPSLGPPSRRARATRGGVRRLRRRSAVRRGPALGRGLFFGLGALGLARTLCEITTQIFGIVVGVVPGRVWRRRCEQFADGVGKTRREPESQQKSLHVHPPVVVARRTYLTTPGQS